MSKLDELIEKLCPDGVEWKELGEVCGNIITGKLNANAAVTNGKYPFFTCDETPLSIDSYAFDTLAILISGNGSKVGHVNIYEGKFNAYQRTYVLHNFLNDLDVKFIYHYFKFNLRKYINLHSKKGSIPYITLPILRTIKIPIPPLEIQEEIVHILDLFTKVTSELTADLEAELTARRKQYEFYRDSLLTFGDEVEWKELGEVCELIMGTSPKGSTISEKEMEFSVEFHQGKTFFFFFILNHSNLYTTSPIKIAEAESILMSVRAPVGDVNMTNRKVAIGRGLCSIVGKSELNTKFLYYFINANKHEFKKKSSGSTFESINTNDIKSIKIPLPSLQEQERIVSILDKFDKLCNDISEGLPAEIEARKKQYEYYRDKLLNFEELKKS